MIFRRAGGQLTWHCCQNCAGWPARDYQERTIEPPRESICPECESRVKALKCEVVPEPGIS